MRQRNIEKRGLRFLRYYDSEVREHLSDVFHAIEDWIEKVEKEEGVTP